MSEILERLLGPGHARLGQLTLTHEAGRILVLGPASGPGAPEAPADREGFRQWIRQTEDGMYRPLSGSRSMRRNWVRTCGDLAAAVDSVDVVYPLALRHLELRAEGRLETVSWDEAVGRQRGMYAAAGELGRKGRALAREVLCSGCVRCPAWEEPSPAGDDAIPCPEPCGMLLALCRAAVEWEREPPGSAVPDPEVRFAEFEVPGNPLREVYLARATR